MSKWITILIICIFPVMLFSEDNKQSKNKKNDFAILSQYSNDFSITNVNFSKVLHKGGKGEVLEVLFKLKNNTNDPMKFYIFVIATYEKDTRNAKSSFTMPLKKEEIKKKIRNFVPFPKENPTKDDPHGVKNFIHTKKDKNGKDVKVLKKFPVNPKKGVDLNGNLYTLNKDLYVRTTHLCNYKRNYNFFNEVVILMYNEKGVGVFKQKYTIKGYRR